MDTLKTKEIIIDKKMECLLSCYNISGDVKKLLDDGEVIFSESAPRENPKKYVVEIEIAGEKLKLTFEQSEKTAKVISAEMKNMNCNCE